MRKLSVTDLNRLSAEDFRSSEKLPLIVVLDNVRSMYNVGSVFRTADAFILESIFLCGITRTPPSVEIHKTALGAEETMAWKYYEDTMDAVKDLKKEGYKVLAIEQAEQSVMLQNLVLSQSEKYALVLGHEVKGVAQDVVDACDGCIEIPQYGTKHSLNVSVAGGMVIWECEKQLRK
ncbi:MAG: TrmH family RNA methyltransferase [Bacteroidia bacterium]|nr:TrmH family RNA methyltransferase [Bacteroidia bacterium]